MRRLYFIIVGIIYCTSCTTTVENNNSKNLFPPIMGTWKLISGTTIKDQDTVFTDYTKDQEMIKIINKSHFAFLRHDLKKGKDSTAIFVAGGGRYSLKGNKHTEHLEYFNVREWENNSFEFEFTIHGDTLITRGVEKIEELNVHHINIEKFIRIKK